jgi:hypothetical protein
MTATSDSDDPRRADAGRYRSAVDHGSTGDKIPAVDPAAAPVQTDAETGGHATPRPVSVAAVREQASHRAPEEVPSDPTNPGRGQLQIPERSMAWLMGVGLLCLVLLGLMVAVVTLP